MSEKKRTWNEKWKLVLNELEEKIGTEGTELERNGRLHGERTERERIRKQKNRRKYETKAEWKKEGAKGRIIFHSLLITFLLISTRYAMLVLLSYPIR